MVNPHYFWFQLKVNFTALKTTRPSANMESIASASKEEEIETLPAPNISEIKNKQLRQEMYRKFKQEKRKVSLFRNL